MPSTNRPRIGFVGVGSMGQAAHLRHYAALSECDVVAVAEIRPKLRTRVAERFGIPNAYGDWQEMVDRESLNGIVAIQPFQRHAVLLPDLLQTGLPLLTEKPLAASVEEGESLLSPLSSTNAVHMVGYHKRCDPATQWAKQEIDRLTSTGELGLLTYVRITMPPGDWIQGGFDELVQTDEAPPSLERGPLPTDMDSDAHQKYVAFVNYYIHQVNLLRHLLGEEYSITHADESGILLVARSASGVPGIIEMSPFRTSVDWQESALVCFEKGYIRIDLPAPLAANRAGRVETFADLGDGTTPRCTVPALPPVSAMREQARAFIDVVQGRRTPPCAAVEALEDLKVARSYLHLTSI